ncbi:MAG: hypothetical protein KJ749_08310, partial [Planctomycetes bacterium]|nr:hypothetical protein [Planctomycetota bacterium]
ATDGRTIYETKMKAANTAIMEVEGCNAAISDEQWASASGGASTQHEFKVTPDVPGRLKLTVKPDQAVSQNNNNRLIGNRYVLSDDGIDETREPVDECQYGTSGLDGLAAYSPPHIPYRWCCWCGEIPPRATENEKDSDPPKSMDDDPTTQRQVAWGEIVAFVVFQDAPGPNTVLNASGMPSGGSFEQIGDWYGHFAFTPDASQVDNSYDVTFRSEDDDGPRNERTIQLTVVPREDNLAFFSPSEEEVGVIGEYVTPPGQAGEYSFFIINDGNTRIRDLALTWTPPVGPGSIPASAIVVDPTHVDQVNPGEGFAVTVTIATTEATAVGEYVGEISVDGDTVTGTYATSADYLLVVNNPPEVVGPTDVIPAAVGTEVAVILTGSDPDLHELNYGLEAAPEGAWLEVEGGADLTLTWTPGVKDTGAWAVPVVADDGWEAVAHEVIFQVEGPVNVNAVPMQDWFVPSEPLLVEAWYIRALSEIV